MAFSDSIAWWPGYKASDSNEATPIAWWPGYKASNSSEATLILH